MTFLIKKSASGKFTMDEMFSGLHKAIRRCLPEDAVFYANEIHFPNARKLRLVKIAFEDMPHRKFILEAMKIDVDDLLGIMSLTVSMANCSKSHITSWLNRVAADYLFKKNIPENELEFRYFRNHWKEMVEKKEVVKLAAYSLYYGSDAVDRIEFMNLIDPELIKAYRYTNFLALVPMLAVLYRCGLVQEPGSSINKLSALPEVVTLTELPDWVYDKHTLKGRMLKRDLNHFFEVSLVYGIRMFPAPEPFELEGRTSYQMSETNKGLEKTANLVTIFRGEMPKKRKLEENTDGPKKKLTSLFRPETAAININKEYSNLLQTQLLTRANGPKVFFGTSLEGKQVVLKGPLNDALSNGIRDSEEIKKLLGLAHTNVVFNSFQEGKFMIGDCLIKYNLTKSILKTSKLESNVIISTNKVPGWCSETYCENSEVVKQMLIWIAFRKCIGANDTCNRNFILVPKNGALVVYSIDDAANWTPIEYMWKRNGNEVAMKKVSDFFMGHLQRHWDYIADKIIKWLNIINDCGVLDESQKTFFIRRTAELLKIDNWKF